MKNREWFIVFVPLFLTWFIDRITKEWADSLVGIKSYGFFGFVLHHNPGAMLGLFADLPPVLRVVSLSTGGAFLVCTYALIQYLLPIRSLVLRTGLSVLLGGILGNVTDRIIYGHVIDFIVVGTVNITSPAFNLADAIQWIGYGMIVYSIIRDGDILWPENNARKQYWINMKFQLKYCMLLLSVGLGIGLVSLVFFYTYLRVTILEIVGNNTVILDRFLLPFVMTFSLVVIGCCAILFTAGKIISHNIAGPIYSFQKFTNDLLDGKVREFRLRTKDEFKELEDLGAKLKNRLSTEDDAIKETKIGPV
jgi:signal peptidase II